MQTVSLGNATNNNQAVNYSQQNFGRVKLEKVKLKVKDANGSYQLTDGFISKLDTKSKKDKKLLDKIYPNWKNTEFAHNMFYRFEIFKRDTNMFVTELKKNCKDLKDNICCLIETTNPKTSLRKDNFIIKYVQSAPEIANKTDAPVKGAGELAVYEAVKTAKNNNFKQVSLFSTNDSFFEKLGFKKVNNSHDFVLKKENYDDFLKNIEQKYDVISKTKN